MNLETTYVQLTDDGAAKTIDVTSTFWEELDASPALQKGRLVMRFSFDTDWDSWERHPKGEEIVTLLSGAVDFVLDHGDRHERVALSEPGSFVVVPRGVWHTAKVRAAASMLFITFGEGTEHRPA